MKSKNLISLTLALAFLAMGVTGLFLYFGQKQWHAVETLHILFGVLFLGFAIFHILNNWSSIKGYSKSKKENKWQKELGVASLIFVIFMVGGALELGPFKALAHGGKILFGAKRERSQQLTFDEVKTSDTTGSVALEILLQKAEAVKTPIIAMWLEDSAHHFVQNLFVPEKTVSISNPNEPIQRAIAEGEASIQPFNARVLPTFAQQAKDVKPNFSSFTPVQNFRLHSTLKATGTYTVYLEIKEGDTVELYQAAIQATAHGATRLQSNANTLVSNAVVIW